MPKGLMVAIGVPKRGGGGEEDDIGAPDELDSAPEPKSKMPPMHEAAEPPAEEGAEDYGARLVNDIDAVGQKHGMEPAFARAVLGDMLAAVAKCLRGESGGEEEAAPEMPMHRGLGAGGYEEGE